MPDGEYRFCYMGPAASRPEAARGELLAQYYEKLLQVLGPQGWWPARTRLEISLGAILTQNTSWRNAALALRGIRKAGFLSWRRLKHAPASDLETCLRPAGFFRQKARAVRSFLDWLEAAAGGSFHRLFLLPAAEVRRQLLKVTGVGPETADAILLYAGKQPYFVADAYTRRILSRHEFFPPSIRYHEAQEFLQRHLPRDSGVYNEFHALLVEIGKRYCQKRKPDCDSCPLREFLPVAEAYINSGITSTVNTAFVDSL